MIRAVTVDAHGTLIVPHPGVGEVYAEVAASYGLERDPAELAAAFPGAFAAVRARWGVPYGADEADARRFWTAVVEATFGDPLPSEVVWELYDTFAAPARWRVLPGAREALAQVAAAGLPAAVVSNFDLRLAPLLAGLGLGPFAAVVVSAGVGRAKPDPAPLVEAARRLGVRPSGILHIGDSVTEDGAMCTAAGCAWLRADPDRGVDCAALHGILAQP